MAIIYGRAFFTFFCGVDVQTRKFVQEKKTLCEPEHLCLAPKKSNAANNFSLGAS